MIRFIFALFFCVAQCAFASQLDIYEDDGEKCVFSTADENEIALYLHAIGVRFERWDTSNKPLTFLSTEKEILKAYQSNVKRLKEENYFETVDVVKVTPDHPSKRELRRMFIDEHTHDEAEVRFFVDGSGFFFLHVGKHVYSVFCEKGDLIIVPKDYRHWFDMGEDPFFTVIRFFTRHDGWIAHFTHDPIAQKFVP